MRKPKLTATTPYGVFTRSTYRDYKFVGVREFKDSQVGRRYEAVWSSTSDGARKNATIYGIICVGVFPVDGTD